MRKKETIKAIALRGKIHKILSHNGERFHVCVTEADFEADKEKVYNLPLCEDSMNLILKERCFKLAEKEDVSQIQDLISAAVEE